MVDVIYEYVVCVVFVVSNIFFFKQKTAYEMRISDWSSDVCSSDLNLEAFCVEHGLPFVRWSGSYPGEWSPERLIFRGSGTVDSYMVDESDRVLLDRRLLSDLGSIEAALAYFDAAEFAVPPLVVEGDPPAVPAESTAASGEIERAHV